MRSHWSACLARFTALVFVAALSASSIVALPQGALAQAAGDDVLSREAVLRDPAIPDLGNPKGDITVVEFLDYQCPYCKTVSPILMQVAREDGNIRIVLKDWPIFGAASVHAARMVLASKYQNKYAEAHDSLLSARSKLTEAGVNDLLGKAGVDVGRATADLARHKQEIDALLARNNAQAQAFGFPGTPAFIIGTFRVPGVLDAQGFKQAIRDARAAQSKLQKN